MSSLTIEQLFLIQRLRETGLTPESVIRGLEMVDDDPQMAPQVRPMTAQQPAPQPPVLRKNKTCAGYLALGA
ncbi:hypothetical protein AAVH_14145 [Aphelenchoides avenae]|nr:hypothetical protein AAVH_14145 [Aphelenchus avenae]